MWDISTKIMMKRDRHRRDQVTQEKNLHVSILITWIFETRSNKRLTWRSAKHDKALNQPNENHDCDGDMRLRTKVHHVIIKKNDKLSIDFFIGYRKNQLNLWCSSAVATTSCYYCSYPCPTLPSCYHAVGRIWRWSHEWSYEGEIKCESWLLGWVLWYSGYSFYQFG